MRRDINRFPLSQALATSAVQAGLLSFFLLLPAAFRFLPQNHREASGVIVSGHPGRLELAGRFRL
jgi:hypothetical protein